MSIQVCYSLNMILGFLEKKTFKDMSVHINVEDLGYKKIPRKLFTELDTVLSVLFQAHTVRENHEECPGTTKVRP